MRNEWTGNGLNGSWWVRPQATSTREQRAAYFRLEFQLAEKPETAVVNLSAADRYRLYVNGRPVCAGPAKGDHFNHYYETLDLAPYLTSDLNAITARVVAFAGEATQSMARATPSVFSTGTGPAFLLCGHVAGKSGSCQDLSTGTAGWAAVPDEGLFLRTHTLYTFDWERNDLAQSPAGWRTAEPLGWPRTERFFEAGVNPYGEQSFIPLEPRPIPNMYEQEAGFVREMPSHEGEQRLVFAEKGLAVVEPHTRAVLELDAGCESTAYLRLAAQGTGGRILLYCAERYFPADEDLRTGSFARDNSQAGVLFGTSGRPSIAGMGCELLPSAVWTEWDSFWFMTFRFVRLEVIAGEAPVTLQRPDMICTGYPLDIQARLQLPSDEMSQLWEISLRTLERCMHETHEDCPYYEQLQYIMDTRLQILFTYAVSGDTRMAQRVLWDFHCSQLPNGLLQSRYPCARTQVIPSFSFHWIFMLEDYLVQTQDTGTVRFYLPTMDRILAYFDRRVNSDGLMEKAGFWDFCDWVPEWDKDRGTPSAVAAGPSTVHNLTYALALQTAARLVKAAGRAALAAEYTERADAVCCAVKRLCWNTEKGLLREGPGFEQYSQHAQALAVLTGLIQGPAAAELMDRALSAEGILACTFPWHFYLFRALEKAGRYERCASIWAPYREILARHLTTMLETPGDSRSDCHAWSAVPLFEYVRMNLGVQPSAEKGWEEIVIRPYPCGLSSLSGTVPTPKGMVSVSWQMDAAENALHIQVKAPAVPIRVLLPDGTELTTASGELQC